MVKPPGARESSASAGLTDVGRQRKHNEDTILVRAELDLFCVADGMGGHNAGDVASKLVATSIANYFEATVGGVAGSEAELSEEYASLSPAAKRLAAALTKANRDVFTISSTVHQHHGMGSTCVAIHLAGGMVHVAHVGDSRAYRIRDGEIEQLTRDHSLINDALEMKPDLTKEELARLPKNIITRALGMKDAVKVDVKSEIARPGDLYLLCSDGLTGMVPVEQILEVLELAPDLKEACELLVAEANDHGGTDNISALLVRAADPNHEIENAATVEMNVGEMGELPPPSSAVKSVPPRGDAPTVQMWGGGSPYPLPSKPSRPPPTTVLGPGAKSSALEIVDESSEADEEALMNETHDLPHLGALEEAALFAANSGSDLDLRGAWGADASVALCKRCKFELLPGNAFCVECGLRVDAPGEGDASA